MKKESLPKRYNCQKLKEYCEYLSKENKEWIKKVSIGKSWDNREISMLILGLGKRTVLLTGGVHGRKCINPVALIKMAEHYCYLVRKRRNQNGICFPRWFEENRLCMIPLLNPDGYEIACFGMETIKNPHLRLKCKMAAEKEKLAAVEWKYNGRGVDLNRNFPCKSWVSKELGDVPASERETKALIRVFQKYHPQLYLDYHSREKSIYYYRAAREDSYNEKQKTLAERLSKLTGYTVKEPGEEIMAGDRGGNTVHYASEYGDCPAITLETIAESENFPLRTELWQEVLKEIWLTPFL